MDLGKVLAELRAELENLNSAILSLERLQKVDPKKRRVLAGDILKAEQTAAKAAGIRMRGGTLKGH